MKKNISLIALVLSILFTSTSNASYMGKFAFKGRGGVIHSEEKLEKNSAGDVSSIKFDTGYLGEISGGYFFNNNFAAEASIGLGGIRVSSSSVSADKKKKFGIVLPVSALAQFHLPIEDIFVPYVGAGYSYIVYESEPFGINIKNSGSPVFQVGFDLFAKKDFFLFSRTIGFNLDVKHFLKTNFEVSEDQKKFKNKMSHTTILAGITFIL